jgi:regulator of sigma E protease
MPWFLDVAVFEIVFLAGLLGQLAMARLARMRVEVFSFGFGPALARAGRVQLALFPLGGYVRVAGLHPTESTVDTGDRRAFFNRPWPLRALVVLGWPIGALLLVMASTATSALVFGLPAEQVKVDEVGPGSPAEAGGLRAGDEILTSDGVSASQRGQFVEQILASGGRPLTVEVRRGGERRVLTLTARETEQGVYRIGAQLSYDTIRTSATLPDALVLTVRGTRTRIGDMVGDIVDLVTGDEEEPEFTGPVGITAMVAAAEPGPAQITDVAILYGNYLVVCSILPLPPLPGGQLLLVLFGWRSRRLRSGEAARDLGTLASPRPAMPPVLLVALLALLLTAAAELYLLIEAGPWVLQAMLPYLLLAGALALRLPRAWAWGVYLPLFLLPSLLLLLSDVAAWTVPIGAFVLLLAPAALLLPVVRRAFGRQCANCGRLAAAPVRSARRTSCLACGSGYATR